MAVTRLSSGFDTTGGPATAKLINLTVPSNATALVALSNRRGGVVSAIKWRGSDGVPLAPVVQQVSSGRNAEMWVLWNPQPATDDLYFSWSNSEFFVAGYYILNGAQRVRDTDGDTAMAGSVSKVLDTGPGDLCIDCLGCDNTGSTVGAGQTARWNTSPVGSLAGAASDEAATGPSVTMSWTTIPTTDTRNYVVASFAPIAGSQVIIIQFRRMQRLFEELKRGLIPPDMLRRRYREVYI